MNRDILAQRRKTHGDWRKTATVAAAMKTTARACPSWARMSLAQQEACDAIITKLARVLCGNPNHRDHWADVAGYASLVSSTLH